MQMLMPIAVFLSWLALPVGLLCIADDWFFRPRRQIAASPQEAHDPPLVAVETRPNCTWPDVSP